MLTVTTSAVGREIPPNDPALRYTGCVRVDANAEHARFDRCVPADGGFQYDAPGTHVSLRTDALSIVARFRGNGLQTRRDAVNGVGVVMVDGQRSGTYRVDGTAINSVTVLNVTNAVMRDVEIWLPYAESVDFLGLTVNDTARLQPVPKRARPRYVAYGDSITQGFWATDVTFTYPVLVAMRNGWELVNLGCGGRQATATDGQVIGSVPADVITILIGFNDHYGNKPLDRYRADVRGMLQRIRAAQPQTPIYLITPPWSTEPFPTKLGLHLEDYRRVLRAIAAEAHDAHLHIVEGPDLIPADAGFFADGIHPNDRGFRSLADKLAPQLKTP